MADHVPADDTEAERSAAPGTATRRAVLAGALAAGATSLLVACGDDEQPGSTASGEDTTPAGRNTSAPQSSSGTETTAGEADGGTEQVAVAIKADIPLGGGVIFPAAKLVITQPTAGEFKGFSSICTHQACPVDNVSDGTINCICHGSKFSLATGDVIGGPAPSGLPTKPVVVEGNEILLAEG